MEKSIVHFCGTGKESKPTITLEAVVDARLRFWHALLRTPGCQKDIVTLDRSPLLVNLMYGISPEVSFECNGNLYNRGYYFKVKNVKRQESVRKDIERDFAASQVSVCFFC